MAQIKCNDCGKEISSKTKNCIHCGAPLKNNKINFDELKVIIKKFWYLIVIGIVLQFFINNKALNLAIKILSIVGMLVVLLAFVLMLVGCIDNSSDFVQTIPAAGSWLFVIFGLVGSGLGIACGKKVKTSKRKRK